MRIKRLLVTGLAALLVVSAAGATYAAAAQAGSSVMRATTAVNVRTAPNTGATCVGVLYPGQTVTATGPSKNGWIPVKFNGKAAWINAEFLAGSAPNAPSVTGRATATTDVNIRAKATTMSASLTLLKKGQSVDLLGGSANGWTPVLYQGKTAYVSSQYLKTSPVAAAVAKRYTTTAVNVRSGPDTSYSKVGLAGAGATISVTGKTSNGWSQVTWLGALRWVNSLYLSAKAPTATAPKTPGAWMLPKVKPQTQSLVNTIRSLFPQIKTVYGWRAGSTGDHGNGLAADFMIPNYKTNTALGWQIANYAKAHAKQLKVQYIIYQQQIWNVDQASKGWRKMANRGSDTANHKDHVHISVKR